MDDEVAEKVTHNVRPWIRFGARYIDISILAVIVGVLFPNILLTPSNNLAVGLILLASWVLIEPLLMCTWGYTIGKWLLSVKIRYESGEKLNLYDASKRSIRVWFFGLGMGLPIVSLCTLFNAYLDLGKNGITSWDKVGALKVSHQNIGYIKGLVAIVCASLIFVLIILGEIEKVNTQKTHNQNTQATTNLDLSQLSDEELIDLRNILRCNDESKACWKGYVLDKKSGRIIWKRSGLDSREICASESVKRIKLCDGMFDCDYICGYKCRADKCEKYLK